ncbi:MAG: glycosyltransferase family 4 protein [Chloroflexota bacterium]
MSLHYLLLGQLQALQAAGHEVVGISAAGPHVPTLTAAGIRHLAVPMTRTITPLADVRALWQLVRLLREERPFIVHTHTPKANLLGQIAAWLANIPVRVCTAHGFYFTPRTPLLKRLFYQLLEWVPATLAQRLFLINQEDMATCRALKLCDTQKTRLLAGGTGVDLHQFSPAPSQLTRQAVGLPPTGPIVGFVGRLVAEKGVPELLAAARLVRQRVPDVTFLLVGPVDQEKPDALTPETAVSYGVADCTVFTGSRSDLPDLYGLMDLFVLPSHREGLSRTLMEAAAMGLPAVTTDVRGCRDVVVNGRSGLVVPLGSVEDLADAISDLLLNPGQRQQMGQAARQLAVAQFDEQVVFAQIEAEYQQLLYEQGLTQPDGRRHYAPAGDIPNVPTLWKTPL